LAEADAGFTNAETLWIAAGMEVCLPEIKAAHAEVLLAFGRLDEASRLLGQAIDQVAQTGREERSGLSEILRIKACALELAGDVAGADRTFQRALDVAREQDARSWELRIAASYAKSLRKRNRAGEGRRLLQPVYDWFTEGHDTRDLREAAALLRELQ
jgi:predicted ATPase